MIRKALLGTAVTLGLGALVFGTGVSSYVRTAACEARDGLRGAVPIEFEIKVARTKLQELDPAVDRAKRVVAEQGIEVDRLRADIDRRTVALEEQARAMALLRGKLGSGTDLHYAGHTYQAPEMRRDLSARLTRYKVAADTLGHKEELLNARLRTLEANEQKLDAMLNARQELEVTIAALEAKHQMVQARETMAGVEVDDTALADVRGLIERIDGELAVRERLLDEEGRNWGGAIPVDQAVEQEAAAQDAVAEFDALFPSQPVLTGDDA